MVRDNAVNRAVRETLPEQFPVGLLADRRAAFEGGGAVGNLLRREREVVRAGFRGEADAAGLGAADQRQRIGRGQVQRLQVCCVPGTAQPQKPTSTKACGPAQARLVSSAATLTVVGMLFSGMSMRVVTPPAAAARVADANPSHSVRPDSLTCT